MLLDDNNRLDIIICSLDEKGDIRNTYHSLVEFNLHEPEAKFTCKYQIVHIDNGEIPATAQICYDTAEDAIADFANIYK